MSEHNNPEDLDLSDTESSSDADDVTSPIVYENTQPLILELHDLKKDTDIPQNPPALIIEASEANAVTPANPDSRAKRLRKKKKIPGAQQQNRSGSISSNNPTENSGATVPPSVTDHTLSREQFYDARESLHTLPENQPVLNPIVQAALAQAQSEHGPKILPPAGTPQAGAQSATAGVRGRRQPSNTMNPVNKPADTPNPE